LPWPKTELADDVVLANAAKHGQGQQGLVSGNEDATDTVERSQLETQLDPVSVGNLGNVRGVSNGREGLLYAGDRSYGDTRAVRTTGWHERLAGRRDHGDQRLNATWRIFAALDKEATDRTCRLGRRRGLGNGGFWGWLGRMGRLFSAAILGPALARKHDE